MSKRFTCTDKWKKHHFRGLSAPHKLLWLYLMDDCDNAGIWHVDLEVASIRIGCDLCPDEVMKSLGDKILIFDDGEKWFIEAFVDFQNGPIEELNEKNNAHKSILKSLIKYSLLEKLAPHEPLTRGPGKGNGNGKGNSKGMSGEKGNNVKCEKPEDDFEIYWPEIKEINKVYNKKGACLKVWKSCRTKFSPEEIMKYYRGIQVDGKIFAFFERNVHVLSIEDWMESKSTGENQPKRELTQAEIDDNFQKLMRQSETTLQSKRDLDATDLSDQGIDEQQGQVLPPSRSSESQPGDEK